MARENKNVEQAAALIAAVLHGAEKSDSKLTQAYMLLHMVSGEVYVPLSAIHQHIENKKAIIKAAAIKKPAIKKPALNNMTKGDIVWHEMMTSRRKRLQDEIEKLNKENEIKKAAKAAKAAAKKPIVRRTNKK